MLTHNPLKRLKFCTIQNSFDTVNTVADCYEQTHNRHVTLPNKSRRAAGTLLPVRQLQVRPHDDADALDHLLVDPLTVQGSQARVSRGLIKDAVVAEDRPPQGDQLLVVGVAVSAGGPRRAGPREPE